MNWTELFSHILHEGTRSEFFKSTGYIMLNQLLLYHMRWQLTTTEYQTDNWFTVINEEDFQDCKLHNAKPLFQ